MGCPENQEIDWENLRTPEQQAVMKQLGNFIGGQLGRGATPYEGALNAPYDPGQLAAMNTMMGMGGYGGYETPQMPVGAQARVASMPASDVGPYNPPVTVQPANVRMYGPDPTLSVGDPNTMPNIGPDVTLSPGIYPQPDIAPRVTPIIGPTATPAAVPSPSVEPNISPRMTPDTDVNLGSVYVNVEPNAFPSVSPTPRVSPILLPTPDPNPVVIGPRFNQ